MKTLTRKEAYSATPSVVFSTIDDLGISGMHMTESSTMMMGSKLTLQFLTQHKQVAAPSTAGRCHCPGVPAG